MADGAKGRIYRMADLSGYGRTVWRTDPVGDAGVEWQTTDASANGDSGMACETCGACQCGQCEEHGSDPMHDCVQCEGYCVGLSDAVVCMDGGDLLCVPCFEQEYDIVDYAGAE